MQPDALPDTEPKRFAIHIDNLVGGGAENVMLTLARALKEKGHSAHFFLLNQAIGYAIPDNLPIHVLCPQDRLSKIAGFFRVRASAKLLEEKVTAVEQACGKFDIHIVNLDATTAVLSHTSLPNKYFVVHNSIRQELKRERKMGPVKYLKKRLQKACFSGKNLICVSRGLASEIEQLRWIAPRSVTAIYNPCDKAKILALSQQENPAIPTEPYLIHVGRFARQKRHDILFEAIKQVPDIPLVLLCRKTNKLLKMAERHGVKDRLILPGFQSNPYNWLARARLKVLSSDYEGLSMVLIESLMCGTPVVSTECDFGPSEILSGHLSQFLSATGDANALTKNINHALSVDANLTTSPILEEVEANKVADRYLQLI
ncbi:glycosyltransferase [Alteromonas sediminis]|uniref:Glycosyltransferase n=1 Tax=Alteromonas sediminis TaxID=2259342 RepID=A0A3N5Y2B0_9ALTE|nr:glycosyltransferase [Alteromonas sediminis]RPJ67123.1 glycosyltransferase [Alteromonas sediminis]